ncbi:uncharacterized protein GIQ15_01693 [Arthroderma uncinatum]|uniref:uncharacterized protein n=1 Tax=Arthroderma uncinatum TaxID=74035 RepID=UPI00144A972D|nr:uncharacterized protein GIQ15_01693 [Arthroderma uncinatum]KAF3492176.1 hypothetical protein GIQ15_01693 [Arthroderma uncinatum]
MEGKAAKTSSMDSSFPVLLPEDPCLRMGPAQFKEYIFASLSRSDKTKKEEVTEDLTPSLPEQPESKASVTEIEDTTAVRSSGNTFVDALSREAQNPGSGVPSAEELEARNLALTDNTGITHASTESNLVDLFHTLDGKASEESLAALAPLLEEAWKEDSLVTLKIIWNCRSIHLGKGERTMFYVALGWLKENHPQTLLANLPWITRAVIEKVPRKEKEGEEAAVVVEQQTMGVDDYEVIHGVSHGYWKDLLNLVALSANDELGMKDPETILKNRNRENQGRLESLDVSLPLRGKKVKVSAMNAEEKRAYLDIPRDERLKEAEIINCYQQETSKSKKRAREIIHHEKLWKKFETDEFHRALHYTVARMFADQLKKDKNILDVGTKAQRKEISLCAKWAPSLERFHDKQTLIATTIAEILFPAESIKKEGDTRELYLKRAREQYRASILSPLRKELQIIERDISANNFTNIKYEQVPSLAMDLYKGLFAKKDHDNFLKYLLDVQSGKLAISGSVLMPGPLVHQWRRGKRDEIAQLTLNAQWDTLVQRIKDNGSLSDSIAVCDVSGSMECASANGASAMDNAIGLSLILSTVTKAPFGGKLITFSEEPSIVTIAGDGNKKFPFDELVDNTTRMDWGGSTDFLAVFTDLILPLAVTNKVKPEDMVKRVFVFSDMQFDQAQQHGSSPWATHYQIIEKEFTAAGYEVPEFIFWDLASSKTGSAPVTKDMPGTALVGGQSQAMLKVFLDGGSFDEAEEDEEMEDAAEDEDGFSVVKKAKKTITPLSILMKAVGHKAYDMLTVVD